MFVSFGIPDKKFGPADDEDEERSARKILTITERFSLPEGAEPRNSIAERVFDLEEESIKLKFHREKDRILSQVFKRGISNNRPAFFMLVPKKAMIKNTDKYKSQLWQQWSKIC